jgi:hypothetical protein
MHAKERLLCAASRSDEFTRTDAKERERYRTIDPRQQARASTSGTWDLSVGRWQPQCWGTNLSGPKVK